MNTRSGLTDQELQAAVVLFAALVAVFAVLGAVILYLAGKVH